MSFGSSCCSGIARRSTGNLTLYAVTCSDQSRHLSQDCSYSIVSGYSSSSCNLREELVIGCYEQSSCTNGDIRLIDGNSSLEGRVEICHQGLWGAIAYYVSERWDTNDAMVVCRQLGYPWECELLCMIVCIILLYS